MNLQKEQVWALQTQWLKGKSVRDRPESQHWPKNKRSPKQQHLPRKQKQNPTSWSNDILFFPQTATLQYFSHLPFFLPYGFPEKQFGAIWSYDFMCVTWNGKIQAVSLCWRQKKKQKLGGPLSHLPGPIIKRQMNCLAEILQMDVITVFGPQARRGEATQRCLAGWIILMASAHTRPAWIWTADLSAGDRLTAQLPAACPLLLYQCLV